MVKKLQKKGIRKISNRAGLFFLLLIFIQLLWALMLNQLNESYFNINTDVIKIFVTLFSFIFPYFIMIKSMKKKVIDVIPIKPRKNHLFSYVIIGLLVTHISNFITIFVVNFLKDHNIVSKTPESIFKYDNTPIGIILFLINLAIVPAITEEFVFRGVILGSLRKFGNGFAIFASALMFSLMHGNIEQITIAFLIGLYLGFCVVKTNSIIPAVLIHFFNNLSSALLFMFKDMENIEFYSNAFFVFVVILSSFFLLNIFKDFKKGYHKTKKTEMNLSLGSKMLTFILTPGMGLFFVYVVVSLYFSLK